MKCDMCNGSGEIPIVECGFPGKGECPQCHGKGYLTNKEYMRSCSSDELADFLWEIVSGYILWDKMHEPQYGGNPKQAFIDWLEEKHNE